MAIESHEAHYIIQAMHVIALTLLLLAAKAPAPALPADLAFLEGCWAGETGDGHIDERYGNTDGGILLGMIKIVRADEVRFFEFLRIFPDAGQTWLQPYPRGRADAPRFRLVQLEADKAAFENPAHDFPRRIAWRLLPGGGLLTRVAGVVDGREVVEEYTSLPKQCDE